MMIVLALLLIITEGNVDRCLHQEQAYDLLVGQTRYHLYSQNNDKLEECFKKSVPVRIEGKYSPENKYHIFVNKVMEVTP